MRVLNVAISVLFVAGTVRAASPDSSAPTVDLQLFQPAPGATGFITTESGDVNSHLGISAGLNLNYARNPLAVQILEADGGEREVGAIVGFRVDANVMAALGLFDIGEFGVVMPLILQGGQDEEAFGEGGANIDLGGALSGFTQGDLRLVPKVRFLNIDDGVFSAAVVGTVILPTAAQAAYASENGVVIAPSLALSTRTSFLRAGVNLGYRMRDKTRVEPVEGQVLLTVDDEVFAKAAVAFDVNMGEGLPFEIVGELFGHTPATNAFAWNADSELAKKKQAARTSFEADVSIRWAAFDNFVITAGGGAGITTQGYGQPAPRLFAGLIWYSGEYGLADADKDGVSDSFDKCPDKQEDRDDFEDSDGCPELDNDKDGVVDEDDQCPNEPEDKDGLADTDGCPETDVDVDGVLDEADQCQGDVEDKDGFKDDDGCADLDNDEDGIADKVDKCPDEAEDVDGFEDVDGCADPDNDGDGLADLGDMCPNFAEDKDNVADDDGCPEDNDGDGIADEIDKCPKEAEIYNGVEDEDGCPEKLKVKTLVEVDLDAQKIVIKDKVFFKSGSAKLMSKSDKLLDQIVSVLKNYKHIRKLRIEGHTDSQGNRRRNIKLSQDRAESVRQYFIANGVQAERLIAEGFGPEKPIASNSSNRGREQNRRVEFVIVELSSIGKDVSEGQKDVKAGQPPAIEMEGLGGESGGGVEMEMNFDVPETDAGAATKPPAPPPAASDQEDLFGGTDFGGEPEAAPEAAPEVDKKKGKKKGKKGKKKKEADPEIEFEF
ncbi:MAG: hypothetical protein A2341_05815 [Deltaproteobacteria bacterium RIFOXYB12_FULL_58_9]|nr:MAG: hypothetical protein A2341_05815 [Deltaproteobacteria bacterium RIFOXYB12_FULL_58_9]